VKQMTFNEMATLYCERQVNTPEGLRNTLLKQKRLFSPDGWMLLECQQFDSSKFASMVILPYGPNNTHKEVPDHPISPRGLASDMSVVVGVLTLDELMKGEKNDNQTASD